MIERICKFCGTKIKAYSTLQNKCFECTKKVYRPISKRGKEARMWETFRDHIARPYLDKKYGIACSKCGVWPEKKKDGTYYRHDVDHIKGRGSHSNLQFDVKNMAYLCRNCHRLKTDRK